MVGLNTILPGLQLIKMLLPDTLFHLPLTHDENVLLLGVNPALQEHLLAAIEPTTNRELGVHSVHVNPELTSVEYFEAAHC